MEKKEETRLVKDGNAFYEVDEVCMRAGLNRGENEGKEKSYPKEVKNKRSYRRK